ncbi:MAG: glycosyltransferase family 2 protein [Bacteroidales bacterium]|nr:glycosyltransferase family 2 protein [Bacteroidales bacterium]
MTITIIISTYNRKHLLKNLLNCINDQLYKNISINIIVVVDGSKDGTLEMLKNDYANIHIIGGDGNWWFTRSMNEGFKYAQKFNPDYVLTFNDDLEIANDYIVSLTDAIPKNQTDVIIGSVSFTKEKPYRILSSGVKKFIPWRLKSYPYYPFLQEIDPKSIHGVHKTYMLPGRGLLISNNVLNLLNFFEERFVQYQSDSDFCLRAIKKKIPVFISWDAKVYVNTSKSSSTSSFIETSFYSFIKSFFNKYSRRYIPNMSLFIWRHGIKFLFPVTLLIFLLASVKAFLFNKKIQ